MSTWTQLDAYRRIIHVLPSRRLKVLQALLGHNGTTSMELTREMRWDRSAVTPRLNELRKMYNAIHKGGVRTCKVSGYKAETWWCGPKAGELTLPEKLDKDRKLALRVVALLKLVRVLKDDLFRGIGPDSISKGAGLALAVTALGTNPKRLIKVLEDLNKMLAERGTVG